MEGKCRLPLTIFKPVADTVRYPLVELGDLLAFKNHKFALYEGEKLDSLVQSIKALGIMNPIIVRHIEATNNYEILSGHNRVNAARLAGLEKVPVNCVDVDDNEAVLIATETNFCQRSMEEMSCSERAAAIAWWHSAVKKQGVRNDLIKEILEAEKALDLGQNETCVTEQHKLEKTRDKTAERFELSPSSVQQYLRIDTLIDELKSRLDDDEFGIKSAVSLSYLSAAQQELLDTVLIENSNFSISLLAAENLKACAKSGKLKTAEDIIGCILGEKKVKKESSKAPKVILKAKLLERYFPTPKSEKDMTADIERALNLRNVTIPALLEKYKQSCDADEITETALKFYFERAV